MALGVALPVSEEEVEPEEGMGFALLRPVSPGDDFLACRCPSVWMGFHCASVGVLVVVSELPLQSLRSRIGSTELVTMILLGGSSSQL